MYENSQALFESLRKSTWPKCDCNREFALQGFLKFLSGNFTVTMWRLKIKYTGCYFKLTANLYCSTKFPESNFRNPCSANSLIENFPLFRNFECLQTQLAEICAEI